MSAQLSLEALPVASPALEHVRARELLLVAVLAVLRRERFGLATDEIARRVRVNLPRAAHALRELVRRGSVDFGTGENDRRERFVIWCEAAPGKRPVRQAWDPYPRARLRS